MNKSRWLPFVSWFLIILSILLRYLSIPHINEDLRAFNLIWYQTMLSQGVGNVLGTTFTNYSPPYSYLLAFVSLFQNFISPLTALKLIPTFFDILGTFIVYKIVRTKYADGNIPLLASAVYFTAPTVILNSSYWGQVDSIYAVFILAAVYFLLTDRSNLAWIALGVSFSIKAQAVFIAPLFLILLLQKRLKWTDILWVPVVFVIAVLPTILLGRQPLDVLLVYLSQSSAYKYLAVNAANLYVFLPREWYSVVFPPTFLLGAALILAWVISTAKLAPYLIPEKKIALYALMSVALTPFLLPKMHDRYFYLADVLSIVVAFLHPELWFLPICFQVTSLLSYSIFLFFEPKIFVYIAAVLNTLTIAFLIKRQRINESRTAYPAWAVRILPLSMKIVIPLIVVGAAFRAIFTPLFLRMDYQLLSFLHIERQGWYQNDLQIDQFIIEQKEENSLKQIQDDKNHPILDKDAHGQLFALRTIVTVGFVAWYLSFLFFYIISVLFWVYSDLSKWLKAIKESGWAAVIAAPLAGLLIASLALSYGANEAVISTLSKEFWVTAGAWVLGFTSVLGLITTKIPASNKMDNGS